jgi:hypothetical protein
MKTEFKCRTVKVKYDGEIIYHMMVEKISEKNLGSKRENWRNLDD